MKCLFLAYTQDDARRLIANPTLLSEGVVICTRLEPYLVLRQAQVEVCDVTELYQALDFSDIHSKAALLLVSFQERLSACGSQYGFSFLYKEIDLLSCNVHLLYYFFCEALTAYALAVSIVAKYQPDEVWVNTQPFTRVSQWGLAPPPPTNFENLVWPLIKRPNFVLKDLNTIADIDNGHGLDRLLAQESPLGSPEGKAPPGQSLGDVSSTPSAPPAPSVPGDFSSDILIALQANFLRNYGPIGRQLAESFSISTFDFSARRLSLGWPQGEQAVTFAPTGQNTFLSKEVVSQLLQDAALVGVFSDLPFDLWPLLLPRVRLLLNADIPNAKIQVDISLQALALTRPRLAVLPETGSPLAKTFGAVAQLLGIPRLVIEHGSPVNYQKNHRHSRPDMFHWQYNYHDAADYMCAWGDIGRTIHIEEFGFQASNVRATGWPWVDRTIQPYLRRMVSAGQSASLSNIQNRPLNVLFLSTSTAKFRLHLYETLFKAVNHFSGQLLIRPHGAEDVQLLQDLAQHFNAPVSIDNSASLLDQIEASDIVLAGSTSVMSYAIALEKPCIYVDLLWVRNYKPYAVHGAAIGVQHADELIPAMHALIHDEATRQQQLEHQRKFTPENLGPLDGHAADRILQFIRDVLPDTRPSLPDSQAMTTSPHSLTHLSQANNLRVDIGCGPRKAPGFIGVDIAPAPGVDIVADLSASFPFDDSTVDELRAYDVIEHLVNRINTMNEIWRVCKPGAKIDIRVPSSDGRGAFQDPTHISFWNINSFKYYCVEFPPYIELCHQYGFKGAFRLLKLDHEQSSDQVIHVNAELEVIKPLPQSLAQPTAQSAQEPSQSVSSVQPRQATATPALSPAVQQPRGNAAQVTQAVHPANQDTQGASSPASPSSRLAIIIQKYQKDPDDRAAIANLRYERQRFVQECLNLDSHELETSYPNSIQGYHQMFLYSGILREPLTPAESAFVQEKITVITQNTTGDEYLQHFLVLSLYCRLDQIPLPSSLGILPVWFLPDYLELMLARPPYYQNLGDSDRYYNHFARFFQSLHQAAFQDNVFSPDFIQQIADTTNFIALYFNEHDLKDLYAWRAEFLEAALEQQGHEVDYEFPGRSSHRQKYRLGILASHFDVSAETSSSLTIYEYISREFEVILYTLHPPRSSMGDYCCRSANAVKVLPQSLKDQVDVIRADDLDLLFVGTNITAISNPICWLSVHRLARIQLTSVTSISTTGFRNIDYFLSGQLTDPSPAAQGHYRESLIQVPGSVHCFSYGPGLPESPLSVSREYLGIAEDQVVYTSGANFFKCVPELLHTWATILANVPNSVLLLLPFGPNWSSNYPQRAFIQHVSQIFAEHGVERDRLFILDPQPVPNREDVKAYFSIADIYLDSYPVCGTTSLMEPLELSLPIVSRKGTHLRSAMGSAILDAMDLSDLVVDTHDAYIQLATDIGTNATLRSQYQQKIRQQMQSNPAVLDSQRFGGIVTDTFKQLVDEYEVKALSDRFNLRLLNLLIFPNWQAPEEALLEALAEVIQAIAHHPAANNIALLIDGTNIDADDAELALSSIAMNLMLMDDAELYDNLEISIVDQMTPRQWQALFSNVQGRIVSEVDNFRAIAQAQAGQLSPLTLDALALLGQT